MRRYRALALLSALLLPWGAGSAGATDREVAAEVLEFVRQARQKAGSPPLQRREVLDRVAAARIRTLRVRPAPPAPNPAVERHGELHALLEAEGIGIYAKAYEYLDVRRGHTRGPAFARWWRSQREAWKQAMDPAVDAVGLATARTDDHWLILVAVLLDEVEPPDVSALAAVAFERVNAFRVGQGLPPVAFDDSVAELLESDPETPPGNLDPSVVRARRVVSRRDFYRGPGDAVEHVMKSWRRVPELLDPSFTRAAVSARERPDGGVTFRLLLIEPEE